MSDFHQLFAALHQYRILICINCQCAIIPSGIPKHLRVSHKRLTLQQRRDIIFQVNDLAELAQVESDVIYPATTDPPVTQLPVYFDGLRCSGRDERGEPCPYICRTPRGIQDHCERHHGWINEQKRGGNARLKQVHSRNKLWTCHHTCQRFFKVGKWQRYFQVTVHGC